MFSSPIGRFIGVLLVESNISYTSVLCFFKVSLLFGCLLKLGHADDRVSCFFANNCRRVRLAERRDRRGRPRTCCLEHHPVQVGLSRAFPVPATLPTMSTTPSSEGCDEITLMICELSTAANSLLLLATRRLLKLHSLRSRPNRYHCSRVAGSVLDRYTCFQESPNPFRTFEFYPVEKLSKSVRISE